MKNQITFTIDGKEFYIPEDYQQHENFTVISVPKNYQVEWDNQEDPAQNIIRAMNENTKNFLLIDKSVAELYFDDLSFAEGRSMVIESIESIKNIYTALEIIEHLEKIEFTKADTLIVVGGGIIQDLGAFVAACFKRGINWVFYPTTLLAMCDSCIGGKTGLNHNSAKNQVALFSAPVKVVLNINFLKTLTASEIRSGLGEIYKLCIIGGETFFEIYEKLVVEGKVNNIADLKRLILAALYIKKAVIEEDEFEKSYRKSLNYGHTFGHAFEILADYKIPHGQAVALGAVIANKISLDQELIDQDFYQRLKKYAFELIDINIVKTIPTENLARIVKKDKKVLNTEVSLVLVRKPGNIVFVKMIVDESINTLVNKIITREF